MNKVHARSKRSKQPARKAPKPGSTPTDRRLIAKAAREAAEGNAAKAAGGSVVDSIVDGLLGPVSVQHTMLAAELLAVADSLGEALGDIIEAHTCEDTEAFSQALSRVNSARVVLQGEAAKLEAVQP